MKAVYSTLALFVAAATAAPTDLDTRQVPAITDDVKWIELHSFKWTKTGTTVTAMSFDSSIHDDPFQYATCSTSFDRSGEAFGNAKIFECRTDGKFTWNWDGSVNKMQVWYTSAQKSYTGIGTLTSDQFNLAMALKAFEPVP